MQKGQTLYTRTEGLASLHAGLPKSQPRVALCHSGLAYPAS